MKRLAVAFLLLVSATAANADSGPFSKFDDNPPDFGGQSSRSIFDVERCLIDMGGKLGAPVVYSQPDRPQEVRLLWISMGRALRRIDLKTIGTGTLVRAWHPREKAAACAGL